MAKATGSKKRKTAKTGRDPRPHGRGWHFLGNLLLLLGIWVTGVLFIQLGGPKRYAGLAEGQRAPATVVASVDFECENLGATELLRQQAGDRVVPVFTIQTGPLQTAIRSLGKLADRAVAVRDMVAASDLPDRPAAEEPPAAEDGNEDGDAD